MPTDKPDSYYRKKLTSILKNDRVPQSVIDEVKTMNIKNVKNKVSAYQRFEKNMKEMEKNKKPRTNAQLKTAYKKAYRKLHGPTNGKSLDSNIKIFYNTKAKLERVVYMLESAVNRKRKK